MTRSHDPCEVDWGLSPGSAGQGPGFLGLPQTPTALCRDRPCTSGQVGRCVAWSHEIPRIDAPLKEKPPSRELGGGQGRGHPGRGKERRCWRERGVPIGDAQDEVVVTYPTFRSTVGLGNNCVPRGVSLTVGFQAGGSPSPIPYQPCDLSELLSCPPTPRREPDLRLVGRAGQTPWGSTWHPGAAACPPFGPSWPWPLTGSVAASAPRPGVCSALSTHGILFLESEQDPALPPKGHRARVVAPRSSTRSSGWREGRALSLPRRLQAVQPPHSALTGGQGASAALKAPASPRAAHSGSVHAVHRGCLVFSSFHLCVFPNLSTNNMLSFY